MPLPDHPRVKEAIDTLLKMFNEENLEKVARAVFRGSGDIPSDKWSFLNRVLMYAHDTEDARGFKQWHEVGRHVMKGSRAFYILGPVLKNITEEKPQESGDIARTEKKILAGFRAIPVFRLEDTEGTPIIKEEYKVNIPYVFNGIIQELGLKVIPSRFCGVAYGSYNFAKKEIKLSSPDIEVFLHELSHAVIGYLMGYNIPLGNMKEYIESYSFKELLNSLSRLFSHIRGCIFFLSGIGYAVLEGIYEQEYKGFIAAGGKVRIKYGREHLYIE